jgi:hypothetical protein
MPQLDASAFPALPDLGSVLTSWIEHADLCEVLRKRAQVVGLVGAVALPRRGTSETASRWLAGTHVVCEIVSRARFGARAFYLALPVDQAAGLLDRVLGGGGQAGVAAALGALSDAECGVLAHLAAHACAACGDAWAVRDVFCADAGRLIKLCAGGAFWPVRLTAHDLAEDARGRVREQIFDAKIVFDTAADCPQDRHALAVSIYDELALDALDALEVGDLLASDAWPLTASIRGLEGRVELSVKGLAERAAATLSGGLIEVTGAIQARSPMSRAELRLGEILLTFWELSGLATDRRIQLPGADLSAATLHVDGEARAAGSLVRVRGTVALRVHSLFTRDSMR